MIFQDTLFALDTFVSASGQVWTGLDTSVSLRPAPLRHTPLTLSASSLQSVEVEMGDSGFARRRVPAPVVVMHM